MGADKSFSMEDLKGADTREKALLVIHGKVYDVVKFLDEHPGGDEVLLGEAGGKDASEAFEDVGHSDEAREIMDGLLVGTCSDESLKSKEKTVTKARVTAKKSDAGSFNYLLPLAALILYLAWRTAVNKGII